MLYGLRILTLGCIVQLSDAARILDNHPVMRLLFKARNPVSDFDKTGFTPLHWAAMQGHQEVGLTFTSQV